MSSYFILSACEKKTSKVEQRESKKTRGLDNVEKNAGEDKKIKEYDVPFRAYNT